MKTDDAYQPNQFTGLLLAPPDALRYDNVGSGPGDAHMLLAKWVPIGASVLDVGAGTGAFGEMLQRERQAKVICLEPDESRAALARERGLTVHTSTVEEFAASSSQLFDV